MNNPFAYTDPTGHVPFATGYDWNQGAGTGGTGPSIGATLVGDAIGSWANVGVQSLPATLPVTVPFANDVGMGLGNVSSFGAQQLATYQPRASDFASPSDFRDFQTYRGQAACHMDCHGVANYHTGNYGDWQQSAELGGQAATAMGLAAGGVVSGGIGYAYMGMRGAALAESFYDLQMAINLDGPVLPGVGGRNFAGGANPNLSVNWGQQNKHIVGTNEYKTANQVTQRSTLVDGVDPQALVNQYAGTGTAANKVPLGLPGSVERIRTDQTVGIYVNNGNPVGPTSNFTIRYGKSGVHIIPAGQ